jgi:CRISPR-associated protein Cmr3
VGLSGTGKSPALRIALKAAHAREARLREREEGGRFVVTDTTTEALAQLMASNPRGILCVNDELAGWLGSIDRYKSQKQRCSADQAFLLSTFDGDAHSIDRRTGDQRHVYIPKASLWVTGGIQPGVLAKFMGNAEREAGLLARLVLASPPPQCPTYSEEEVSASTQARFEEVVSHLFALEGDEVILPSEEAKHLWIKFHSQTSKEMLGLPPDLAAAWSKSMGTALRIALILHLASPSGETVSLETMRQAITLTEWFKNEAKRIYQNLGFSVAPVQQARPSLDDEVLAWIRDQPDCVAVRDVYRGRRKFRDSDVAEASLLRLAAEGRVRRIANGHGASRYVAVDHDAADTALTACPVITPPTADVAPQPPEETTWNTIPRN